MLPDEAKEHLASFDKDECAYALDALFINAKVNKNNYASYNSIDEYIKKSY
jgi:hypothetical protein